MVDPAESAYALHGMLNSTIYLWMLQARPSGSLAPKADTLLHLFFHGVDNHARNGSGKRARQPAGTCAAAGPTWVRFGPWTLPG